MGFPRPNFATGIQIPEDQPSIKTPCRERTLIGSEGYRFELIVLKNNGNTFAFKPSAPQKIPLESAEVLFAGPRSMTFQ